jgi:hypothetical protein
MSTSCLPRESADIFACFALLLSEARLKSYRQPRQATLNRSVLIIRIDFVSMLRLGAFYSGRRCRFPSRIMHVSGPSEYLILWESAWGVVGPDSSGCNGTCAAEMDSHHVTFSDQYVCASRSFLLDRCPVQFAVGQLVLHVSMYPNFRVCYHP